MGVIVNKNNQDDELSRRISADLRAKAIAQQKMDGKNEDPDFVEDSEYAENMQKTGRFAWVWIVLVFLAILSLVFIFLF